MEEEMSDEMQNDDDLKLEDGINPAKLKRLCKFPGCTRVIKSQGHCQRHGAKAKRCCVQGCDKQAQGTHAGMCKRHFKALHHSTDLVTEVVEQPEPPIPDGQSVYDEVIPNSIGNKPPNPTAGETNMPLVDFLQRGAEEEPGWHRNAERRARGLPPVKSLSTQLETWERQLALVETMLLSGGTPNANFKDLAHAWGREKGFHTALALSVCERRGTVERKKRSDRGKRLSGEALASRKKHRPAESIDISQGGRSDLALAEYSLLET